MEKVGGGEGQTFGVIRIENPSANLPVGSLQAFLYVHGEEVVCKLGGQPGNAGFYVSGMRKNDIFKTIILDDALLRKTFSIGGAREKRLHMEARKIL